ncbi:MAG: carboxypeptidase-like regulatory domain-containing protein [Muribaculaceae bacterium]|nr:carboxypeptidase-like regulatory domain-containing protein [Muribaculaceae bacterium]
MRKACLLRIVSFLLIAGFFGDQALADVIQKKDTVTGTVIDRKKQPLPGAKVEILGQSYSAFTDIDGRFNIKCEPGAKKVLVTYPKARAIKKKIQPDMTVQVGRTWRQVPERYQWFVGANIGIGMTFPDIYFPRTPEEDGNDWDYYRNHYDVDFYSPTISVMAGRVKVVGWYVKAFVNPAIESSTGYDYTNSRCSNLGMIVGGMVRLGCPLHLYLGGGFTHTNFSEIPQDYYHKTAYQFDMGLLFRIKDNFGINWSMNVGESKNSDYFYASYTNIGFCYFFNK